MVTLLPVAEYVGMNLQKDSYLPLSHDELNQCISHDISTYMCYLRSPIFKLRSDKDLCMKTEDDKCRSNIETCSQKWLNLINTNTYFHFCCDSCQLRVICSDRITAIHIEHANIISLDENCVIKTENYTVYAHKDSISTMQLRPKIDKLVIPQINNILNITFEPIQNITRYHEDTQKLMNDLEHTIIKMKESNPSIENVSTHDIHQYSIMYGTLLVASIVAIVTICRRRIKRRKSSSETIELEATGTASSTAAPTAGTHSTSYDVESASNNKQKIDKGTSPISSFKTRDFSV
ncbi:hypothetical protein NE865_14482 [Phthorimaea operculella]|nr:hypothetical protein NE865_14482 [Phthorimaea operculella]